MATPMDEQMIECEGGDDATTEQLPAIDESWVETREYGRFYLLKSEMFGTLHEKTWLKQMGELENCLNYLRSLDYHSFWSTIIYDPEPLLMIDSYLKHCPRYTDAALSSLYFHGRFTEVKDMMKNLHANVLRVLLRMMVQNESEECFLSTKFFARVIYDHKIVTITRLMDICAVYSIDNLKALQRAVAQVFKLQPALLDDLKKDGEIVSQLLHKAANEAERAAAAQGRQRVFHMKTTELDMRAIVELCAYLVDVASTLTAFVTVFPDALRVFHQVGLTSELPSITERLCVSLAAELFFRIAKSGFSVNVRLLIGQLESFKKSTVQLFRQLLEKNAIYDPTLPADEAQKRAEDFVGLITAALDCENFIFVYNDVYPLETDLKQLLVNQLCTQPTIDYVRATLETICAKQVEMLKQKLRRRGLFQNLGKIEGNADLTAAVSEVQDLLPDESTEYIHLCLRHYGYQSRNVIDALLDDKKMPLDLRRLRGQMIVPSDATGDAGFESPPPSPTFLDEDGGKFDDRLGNLGLDQHLKSAAATHRRSEAQAVVAEESWTAPETSVANIPVHEDDERVAVPIRRGKKHGESLSSAVDMKDLKNFFDHLQFDDESGNAYDDEYDDTYDGLGVEPADPRDQEAAVTKFETARLNEQVQLVEEVDALPASARRRPPRPDEEPRPFTADYTGGRSRQLKERNKGFVAGHNRKAGAMKKMRQGMI